MSELFVIAGPAGSGKTTLGRALALHIDAPHLDLDDVTSDLVEEFLRAHPERDHASVLLELRDRRYRELSDQVGPARASRPAQALVLIAPFTEEISSEASWNAWLKELDLPPAHVHLVWLEVPADERFRRIAGRAAARDESILSFVGSGKGLPVPSPPAVPCLVLDALMPVPSQVERVMQRFGNASDSL